MAPDFSIKVYKQYFNFASSHFLIFQNGTREPLHGHNYRVSVCGRAPELSHDLVFDFLDIKPIIRELCDSLDHKLLLPGENPLVEFLDCGTNLEYKTPDGSHFSFPKNDVLILPLPNISAERLAVYLARKISEGIQGKFNFKFSELEVEVEETPGQSATYCLKENTHEL
ncbi:MAG: 6-pyruvoyl trahydropterin synthase family protein [Bacteriovoracales bacterium]